MPSHGASSRASPSRAHVILELNTFADDFTIDSFVTKYEAGVVTDPTAPNAGFLATRGEAGQSGDPASLAIRPVMIHNGLRLVIQGSMTIASIVKIDGRFVLVIAHDHIDVAVDATMKLNPIGEIAIHAAMRIDGDGLAMHIELHVGAGFGGAMGLEFNANGLLELNTASFTKTIPGANPGRDVHASRAASCSTSTATSRSSASPPRTARSRSRSATRASWSSST